MAQGKTDPFNARKTLKLDDGEAAYFALDALGDLGHLPYSIKVLLEAALRNCDGYTVSEDDVKRLADWNDQRAGVEEIPFKPARVVLQDFTGVPAVVDLAALRDACKRLGGDPKKINPLVPCDLVIDHSVQVDEFASNVSLRINSEKEFERNRERYEFLKWGQQAFNNFRVVPPATGIVHQVNLEYLAKVVWECPACEACERTLYPDSLVGTDSHTTMINGLGVVGWGVGGIEAEAIMLGQPIYMIMPEVVGFKLTGEMAEGVTATDVVLTVTQMLREHGVVGKFVEFFGEGLANMPLANRATIANMAPEYGATMGFFPVDERTLEYMHLTGRDESLIQTVEAYCKAQGLWRDERHEVRYSDVLELDLSMVEPSLAGPKRPQDRIALSAMQSQWRQDLSATFGKANGGGSSTPDRMLDEGGQSAPAAAGESAAIAVAEADPGFQCVNVECQGESFKLKHGSVVIAAITSCTNTSNPEVMIAAGLVAKKAVERGLGRKPWVKTSLAPGSKVVTEYYEKSGLMDDLEQLGFNLVGYGCTTCIGNSGPLPEPISEAVQDNDLVVASVLSGNRNFEGRVHSDVKANYLASPPLVVAYAIAGTVDIDLRNDPIGKDSRGEPVYLEDIWPSRDEIQQVVKQSIAREQFLEKYADVFKGAEEWREIETSGGDLYDWDPDSTYIQHPPFFASMGKDVPPIEKIDGARVLCKLGDSVTTDHISPAGAIKADSPAGEYLQRKGVPVSMFNSYGSRRGNHEVMMRGTFANVRVRNELAPGTEGGYTTYYGPEAEPDPEQTFAPDKPVKTGEVCSIYDGATGYIGNDTPLLVLAGKDYGMGSSRDWAAKGTGMLGVGAVIAESYERIHRSNLIGMGVLPLQFTGDDTRESLGLTGKETFVIEIDDELKPSQEVTVTARSEDGKETTFTAKCRIDTPVEVDYYRNGGILHTVLRQLVGD